jgi:hypothetical protein
MPSRQQSFVEQAYWDARTAGLPDAQARVAAAQAALETGYGKSAVGNNYYGIKSGSSWTGPTVTANTWEDVGGRRQNERASFRAYDEPKESFLDWAGLVSNNWPSVMSASTFEEAVDGLGAGQRGGYATDRSYDSKLGYINEKFDPNPLGVASLLDIPTPQARPDVPTMQGSILQAIDPATPMAVTSAPLDPIEPAFDMGRFGPEVAQPSVAAFDMERFGPQIQTPTAPSAVVDRMPATQPVAQGLAGLQRGLLDQQLAQGILPNIPPSIQAPTPAVAYVDPIVSKAPAAAAIEKAAPAQPIGAQPNAPAGGFMGRNNPALRDWSPQTRGLLGGIGSAVLGGALLGPVGAALGGLLGNSYFGNASNYYPSAPEPIAGQPQNSGSGYSGLSEYGQQAYNDSQDFRDAVDSGAVGLW